MLGQSKTVLPGGNRRRLRADRLLALERRSTPRRSTTSSRVSDRGMWNQLDYRPLEGFVYAVSPFNFTAIGGNLSAAPALMGNTVVWKPASSAMLSAWYVISVLEEAGLPPGVINFVPGDAADDLERRARQHRDLAGVHFTGSTAVFNNMWKTIGENMARYRSYPRIVGETGGKDFIVAHPSRGSGGASRSRMARGAFEYQGQKCSAASRAYVPQSMWNEVRERMRRDHRRASRWATSRDFRNFMGAVIDKRAFDKISGYIDDAQASPRRSSPAATCDGSKGYFIAPTLVETKRPGLQAPVRGDLRAGADGLRLPGREVARDARDRRSHVALRADRRGLRTANAPRCAKLRCALRHAAGNFYINDKPTGAVVGQQPFGGARARARTTRPARS